MLVEIDNNVTDKITHQSLNDALYGLRVNLNEVRETNECIGFESWDDVEVEIASLLKHIEYLEFTASYFKTYDL